MRVTPGIIGAQVARDLHAALAALSKQQRLIATGRRINEPADDPSGTARALTVRSRSSANAQFERNLDTARTRLTATESSLRAVVDMMQQTQELAMQGASDGTDAAARQAIGTQIDQILEAIFALANDRAPDGTRLFGGTEVTAAPYTATRDVVTNRITAVVANPRGIDGVMSVEVTEGLTVAQNVSGTTAFGSLAVASNTFSTLIRLRDALDAGVTAPIGAELDVITVALDRLTTAGLSAGARLGWLDALGSQVKDEALSLAGTLGRLEDADMTKAISELAEIEMYYQGGLAAGARLLRQSLLDFLR
jgi:flagellar hook-associated protein 3 FlgL